MSANTTALQQYVVNPLLNFGEFALGTTAGASATTVSHMVGGLAPKSMKEISSTLLKATAFYAVNNYLTGNWSSTGNKIASYTLNIFSASISPVWGIKKSGTGKVMLTALASGVVATYAGSHLGPTAGMVVGGGAAALVSSIGAKALIQGNNIPNPE